MTTTMIEIRSFDDATQTETTFRPFAWFDWPLQLVNIVGNTFSRIRITHKRPRVVLVRRGGLRDIRRQEIIEGGPLTPIVTRRRFESAEEFREVAGRNW